MSKTCTHLDQIEFVDLPDSIAGCEDCLATGGTWVHLRMCQSCGRIGCCDSSAQPPRVRACERCGAPRRTLS